MEPKQIYATTECVVAVYEQSQKTLYVNQNALDSELIQAFQQILVLEFSCLVSYVEPKLLVERVRVCKDSCPDQMGSKNLAASLTTHIVERDFSQ